MTSWGSRSPRCSPFSPLCSSSLASNGAPESLPTGLRSGPPNTFKLLVVRAVAQCTSSSPPAPYECSYSGGVGQYPTRPPASTTGTAAPTVSRLGLRFTAFRIRGPPVGSTPTPAGRHTTHHVRRRRGVGARWPRPDRVRATARGAHPAQPRGHAVSGPRRPRHCLRRETKVP